MDLNEMANFLRSLQPVDFEENDSGVYSEITLNGENKSSKNLQNKIKSSFTLGVEEASKK